ncbi:hypothetical protein A9K55_001093 [Cordyceps militaris]|uniref:Uncharacterized protein n=1 Tax=Cordyceps militaris TaxID=73501 RepID=A0A2H4SV24_CORMI|nr:hypothetical protein A9K55_001093 [Cordyceps militaris]
MHCDARYCGIIGIINGFFLSQPQHAVDRCPSYGRRGHAVLERPILVGYACTAHASRQAAAANHHTYSDSGYSSYRSSSKGYK